MSDADPITGGTGFRAECIATLATPSQLGVEYNAHALESILEYVAPELGWR